MSEACDTSKNIILISYVAEGNAIIEKINKVEKLLKQKIKELSSISISVLPEDIVEEDEEPASEFVCGLTETIKSSQVASIISKSDITEDVNDILELLEQEYCSLEQELKELKAYVCQN